MNLNIWNIICDITNKANWKDLQLSIFDSRTSLVVTVYVVFCGQRNIFHLTLCVGWTEEIKPVPQCSISFLNFPKRETKSIQYPTERKCIYCRTHLENTLLAECICL